ncbi:MAG: UdgX family uracil-DNA binding protein [Proteobacteria bacterium]|nr:UdgX family uracil-DNA binding protein [Pseudomonadota bacterium]
MELIRLAHQTDFDGWRTAARTLRSAGVPPERAVWTVGEGQGDLWAGNAPPRPLDGPAPPFNVPRDFIELAQEVVCHRAEDRWSLLYSLLWRLMGEPQLLKIVTDPEVARALELRRNVVKAVHKMHAFVRFREVPGEEVETFVAWFEPAHRVVELASPFFARRFANMRFSILTPDRCAHWDGDALTYTPGASKEDAPSEDALEAFWRTYYASIFNPARLKTRAMRKEMPKQYWGNLPEASLIPDLIAGAGARTEAMVAAPATVPPKRALKVMQAANRDAPHEGGFIASSTEDVAAAIQGCRRCELWRNATQGVAGAGPRDARMMIVGEQPGDVEDLKGAPFVGPAGQLLDRALAEAGVDRTQAYVTNAVKHFKFEPRGKRRLHKTPDTGEIRACRWWLEQETRLVKPNLIVALGGTAASSVFGRTVAITRERGRELPVSGGGRGFVTFHPSYLLRLPDEAAKAAAFQTFVADLRTAGELASALA